MSALFLPIKRWLKLISYSKHEHWKKTYNSKVPLAAEISSSQFPCILSSNADSISQFSSDIDLRISWSPALLYFPILSTCGSIPTLSRTPEKAVLSHTLLHPNNDKMSPCQCYQKGSLVYSLIDFA